MAAAQSKVPFDSIARYQELQRFVDAVGDACAQAQDAAGQQKLHVVSTLESIREQTWADIKAAFTSYVSTSSLYNTLLTGRFQNLDSGRREVAVAFTCRLRRGIF